MNHTADLERIREPHDLTTDAATLRSFGTTTFAQPRPADNDESCGETAPTTHDIEAWARDAHAANGFGDAVTALSLSELHAAARAHRARFIGDLLAQLIVDTWAMVRRAVARHRQHRAARAAYDTLSGLDDRTLRDLGFHRSEIGSVAAESAGIAESTRIHTAGAYGHSLR